MARADRSLVLVAGSGRSGTSLLSGILQRLGMHVPQPEVPKDPSNPRGFAESQWVVDFHTRLLNRADVQVSDGRPVAWAQTAELAMDDAVADQLRDWLGAQLRGNPDVVVKDPRLSWFLPLWRRCAVDLGATPLFVTMLRHPAAVVDSKQRWYGGWQGEVARAGGWLNQTLFTERATRGERRVYLQYEDLLADWTVAVSRLGRVLDVGVIDHAPAPAMQRVHSFVDPSLSRSRTDWGDLRIPDRLRAQCDETWDLVASLAADAPSPADAGDRLDRLRERYIALYEESESIARSSVAAARRPPTAGVVHFPPRGIRMARRIPRPIRRSIPPRVRARIARRLRGRRLPAAAAARG